MQYSLDIDNNLGIMYLIKYIYKFCFPSKEALQIKWFLAQNVFSDSTTFMTTPINMCAVSIRFHLILQPFGWLYEFKYQWLINHFISQILCLVCYLITSSGLGFILFT